MLLKSTRQQLSRSGSIKWGWVPCQFLKHFAPLRTPEQTRRTLDLGFQSSANAFWTISLSNVGRTLESPVIAGVWLWFMPGEYDGMVGAAHQRHHHFLDRTVVEGEDNGRLESLDLGKRALAVGM